MAKVKETKLDAFKPQGRNANRHSQRGLGSLESSMRKHGYVAPMTAAADGEIIDGSARLETVANVFDDDVLVVEHDGTKPIVMVRTDIPSADSPEAREISIAANRIAELNLTWDAEVLLEDLQSGVDLKGLFNQSELDALLDGLIEEEPMQPAEAQIDKAQALLEKWKVKPGDMFALGSHRLICGDSTDKATIAKLMQGEKADAVVTDPPYGQNQAGVTNDEPEKLKGIIDGCVKNLPCDNAVIVAFSSPRTFIVWLDAIRANGFNFERMLWMYKAAQETFPWRGWLLKSEAIVISSIGKGQWQDVHPYSHDCYYKSEVSGQLDESLGWHGSVKPLDVVSDLVARVSAKGQIVYEPFSGSGTTLMACESLGRQCRAIDIDASFVAITLQRYKDSTNVEPVLIDS